MGEIRGFHEYAPTGYALAIEADEETAVNFGMVIYVKLPKKMKKFEAEVVKDSISGLPLRK
ncbi:MAG: CRISPR-associated protein Cas4 [Thermoproteota archaeon]